MSDKPRVLDVPGGVYVEKLVARLRANEAWTGDDGLQIGLRQDAADALERMENGMREITRALSEVTTSLEAEVKDAEGAEAISYELWQAARGETSQLRAYAVTLTEAATALLAEADYSYVPVGLLDALAAALAKNPTEKPVPASSDPRGTRLDESGEASGAPGPSCHETWRDCDCPKMFASCSEEKCPRAGASRHQSCTQRRPENCKHGKPLTMYDTGTTSADCLECATQTLRHQSCTQLLGFDGGKPGGDMSVKVYGHRHEQGRVVIDRVEELPHQVGRESSGADAIAAERVRQMEVEKWNTDHDDDHEDASLTHAALCYARLATFQIEDKPYAPILRAGAPIDWPWTPDSYKPKDARRNLVRAGALIAAEIDRLDRAEKLRHVACTKQEGAL